MIFAKNSDRPANECQPLRYYPRAVHPVGSSVRCTHREIPQVRETAALIGSQPSWMWGFEIGINEYGVAIGNEAVYGRAGYEEAGLLGMDYLRLGLERGRTAYQALHIITALLEEYGQGGSADLVQPRTYHNSFIIADPREAWVLETAGRYWVTERVKERRAISNCYTIQTEWDEASPKLIEHAVKQGWWKESGDFSFARAYGDPAHDFRSGQCRFRRATELLVGGTGLEIEDLMALLRDHEGDAADGVADRQAAFPICMHEAPPRLGATAASLVVHLRPHVSPLLTAVAWHSFGSPCLSAFHPLYTGSGSIDSRLGIGAGHFDPSSPFWLSERIQRRAGAYPALKPLVQRECQRVERTALEAARNVAERLPQLAGGEACAELHRVQGQLTAAFLETLHHLDEMTARLAAELPPLTPADQAHWSALNAAVGLELLPAQSGMTG
ncbi:MAG: C69 family dipeptidase [Chloroflexi bacterium]|nr:C69 family dipeptidase [Chloroflexota bacterium]